MHLKYVDPPNYTLYSSKIKICLMIKNMKFQLSVLIMSSVCLAACQPKDPPVNAPVESKSNSSVTETSLPLIHATTQQVALAKSEACQPAESADDFATCSKYHVQTIQSNVKWIDDYFMQRLKADYVEAFDATPSTKVTLDPEMPSINYATASVRFAGQHYHLANFEYFSDYFPVGAAHGMHHSDYVVFDLKSKQRLKLNDILLPASKEKLKAELYSYNSRWLEDHQISEQQLELSENFYYGSNGIVFVYPLYELASYAEGISELELPYWAAKEFIKAEYLPQLPESSEDLYQ